MSLIMLAVRTVAETYARTQVCPFMGTTIVPVVTMTSWAHGSTWQQTNG